MNFSQADQCPVEGRKRGFSALLLSCLLNAWSETRGSEFSTAAQLPGCTPTLQPSCVQAHAMMHHAQPLEVNDYAGMCLRQVQAYQSIQNI